MAYEIKTKATPADVDGFIARSPAPADGATLSALMAEVTGLAPTMWGPSIIGFGKRTYDLSGGKQGQICALGFSPRKASLVLYLKHTEDWDQRLAGLGKHSTGKGCLYIKKLADVDAGALKDLIAQSWREVQPSLV